MHLRDNAREPLAAAKRRPSLFLVPSEVRASSKDGVQGTSDHRAHTTLRHWPLPSLSLSKTGPSLPFVNRHAAARGRHTQEASTAGHLHKRVQPASWPAVWPLQIFRVCASQSKTDPASLRTCEPASLYPTCANACAPSARSALPRLLCSLPFIMRPEILVLVRVQLPCTT